MPQNAAALTKSFCLRVKINTYAHNNTEDIEHLHGKADKDIAISPDAP